jgi:nucleotide-binding universal stress UspA family protein
VVRAARSTGDEQGELKYGAVKSGGCIVGAVRRIVVGVHGSLGSLQALRWAAAEASDRHVTLVPVIAWLPPGGDLAERSHPSPHLRRAWREAAAARLTAAFEEGLGGLPADLQAEPRVERGDTGPVLVDVASEPGDLLVIGTGRRHPVSRALRRSVGRYCLAHARCPVIAVPPSALMDEVTRGWRRTRAWSLRGVAGTPSSPGA